MWKDFYAFVTSCLPCQQNKDPTHKLGGLLQPLSISEGKWTHLSMDFTMGLPHTRKKWDSIYVVEDCMTKVAHFIPSKVKYMASMVAKQCRILVQTTQGSITNC